MVNPVLYSIMTDLSKSLWNPEEKLYTLFLLQESLAGSFSNSLILLSIGMP